MFDDMKGLSLQRARNGDVTLIKRKDESPDSEIIFEVTLTAEQWSRAVASVAHDCASCRAYFMAWASHMGNQSDPPDLDEYIASFYGGKG